MKRRFFLIFYTYILLTISLGAKSGNNFNNIIILAPRYSSNKCTEEIINGAKEVISKENNINLQIEYIDTSYSNDNKYNQLLKDISEYKMEKNKADVFIYTDPQILSFIQHRYSNRKVAIPIILCRTVFEPQRTPIKNNFIYEITNDIDIKTNFDLIKKLHPNCKNILCITDMSKKGQIIQKKIQQIANEYNEDLTISVISNTSIFNLANKVKILPENSVILFTFFQKDNSNKEFSFNKSIDLLFTNTSAPIYTIWDFNITNNIIGGFVSSSKEQGKLAAIQALKILNGKKISDLKSEKANKRYIFNYKQLVKNKIDMKNIPENAVIYNQDKSFYEKNKFIFWNIVIYFFILLVIIIILIVNISAKVVAEKHLISARNYLRDVIDCMPSILISVDEDFLIKNYNKPALLFSKSQIKNIYNRKFADVFSELGIIQKHIEKVFENKKPLLNKKIEIPNSKDPNYFNLSIYQLSNENEKEVVILMDDITEKNRIEELLIQSEKMMSVGGLAAGMAHEINNPLAGILQGVQILELSLQQNIPKNEIAAEKCEVSLEKINHYFVERNMNNIFESIKTSVQRAANIVTNMLSFSKKSSNRKEFTNIAELFDKTIELTSNDYQMKKEYSFRKIIFNKFYQSPIKLIQCFPGEIQQVFLNILKNGAQAMAESNNDTKNYIFDISISQNDNETIIEIADNGPGMDDETKKRIFEPFYTKRKSGKGIGLGLSISYFIITENHHGNLMVESKKGFGSKFTILLPMEENDEKNN